MRKMNKVPLHGGKLVVNNTQEEESLKVQLEKVKTMGDQGFVTKGLMYSERSEGVRPEFDIRADKWEIAERAAQRAGNAEIALRTGGMGKETKAEGEGTEEGGAA